MKSKNRSKHDALYSRLLVAGVLRCLIYSQIENMFENRCKLWNQKQEHKSKKKEEISFYTNTISQRFGSVRIGSNSIDNLLPKHALATYWCQKILCCVCGKKAIYSRWDSILVIFFCMCTNDGKSSWNAGSHRRKTSTMNNHDFDDNTNSAWHCQFKQKRFFVLYFGK